MTLQSLASLVLVTLIPAATTRPQNTPALRHGVVFGTFSDLRYSTETGDVNGTEITVVPQYRSAYAIFQCAEGAPTDPIFVPVTVNGDRITFTVSDDNSCTGIYTGLVTVSGMRLYVNKSDFDGNGFLPRRKSYWAK